MAQTSTNIQSAYNYKTVQTGTVISFSAAGNKIISSDTQAVTFSAWSAFDLIRVTGSNLNNKIFTVRSVAHNGSYLVVEESVTDENSISNLITLTPYGVITDKYEGDGFYSQVDGMHTVAYYVTPTFTGSIKMQATLEFQPTENDWFDVADTIFVGDQSTTARSFNFIGNFVWVRAKCYNYSAGGITKILYNH